MFDGEKCAYSLVDRIYGPSNFPADPNRPLKQKWPFVFVLISANPSLVNAGRVWVSCSVALYCLCAALISSTLAAKSFLGGATLPKEETGDWGSCAYTWMYRCFPSLWLIMQSRRFKSVPRSNIINKNNPHCLTAMHRNMDNFAILRNWHFEPNYFVTFIFPQRYHKYISLKSISFMIFVVVGFSLSDITSTQNTMRYTREMVLW